MRITEMKEIAISYANVIGFLHISDIKKVEELAKIVINNASFRSIADTIIAQYEDKEISNKAASEALEIIKAGSYPMTERFRREGSKVYSFNNGSYIYIGNYSNKEFKELIETEGRFI